MVFRILTRLCNHHHNLIIGHFHHPKRAPLFPPKARTEEERGKRGREGGREGKKKEKTKLHQKNLILKSENNAYKIKQKTLER